MFKSEESLDKSNRNNFYPTSSLISKIDPNTEPLIYAQEIQARVSKIGFDWETPQQALPKLYEELGEISEALNEHEEQHLQEERGDLMFSAMNLIRIPGYRASDILEES